MATESDSRPVLYVLAGVNGAGKSSIGGALLRSRGLEFFNPDEFAHQIKQARTCDTRTANAEAWRFGRQLLERAITEQRNHAFETTLGGNTMPALIHHAATQSHRVIVWYCGLDNPDLHIERVRQRVAAGGHDIPETLVRSRWRRSRENLIGLMPVLHELRVFDNSQPADQQTGRIPPPVEVLHVRKQTIVFLPRNHLPTTPEWAQPIVEAALELASQM